MASLYLDPDLEPADAEVGARVRLRGDEARHAIAVARVRPGERLAIADGAGFVVRGPVVDVASGELSIEVDDVQHDPEPEPRLWLAQALAKGDRDELAIQAATELGVSGVIPWQADRSVSRWDGPKAAKGRERWAAIVREATKQSIRSRVPEVLPLGSPLPGLVLVLEPAADRALTAVELPAQGDVTLVVGPEGGLTARELALGMPVRLGAEVLRTSTAGPAALAVLNARLGRW
ncbi:16S rRNA (uracil(1498)-N(3))-methyltransferase [Pseudolysinimonas kribbensis]|uniref:16S rRNA (uracil(1498)-N(3))-methyltransferase n=1 Tax=Pseudolysinimonas kribbensis TaxID=433641 RepID=UPI0031DC8F46